MERQEKHQRNKEEAEIIAYLLGRLTEIESDDFEQRYLEDSALFAEMQKVEDELIDDYASGAMSKDDRIRFEQHLLQSPDRREKVRFAIAMTERAASLRNERGRTTSPTPLVLPQPSVMPSGEEGQERGKLLPFRRLLRPVPAWREWGAIAAAVLISLGAGAVWVRNRELRQDLLSANIEEARLREQARSESARAEEIQGRLVDSERERTLLAQNRTTTQPTASPTRSFNAFISLEYSNPTTMGSSEVKKKSIKIPANTPEVTLLVELESARFHNFSATLQRTDGSSSWSTPGNLKAKPHRGKQSVLIRIPGAHLSSGDYWLTIIGVGADGYRESIGSYYVSLLRH